MIRPPPWMIATIDEHEQHELPPREIARAPSRSTATTHVIRPLAAVYCVALLAATRSPFVTASGKPGTAGRARQRPGRVGRIAAEP